MNDEPAQLPDGGFPAFWSAGQSSVDGTCYRLDVGGLRDEQRQRALDFLTSRRSQDGTWREREDQGGEPPPWLDSTDPKAVAYLSWNCALTLARAGRLVNPPPVEPVGYRQTTWLAAATLLWLGRGDEAIGLLDHLDATIADLDADDRAWVRRALGTFGPFTGRPGLTRVVAGDD